MSRPQRTQSDLQLDPSALSSNLDLFAPQSTLTKGTTEASFTERAPQKDSTECAESETSQASGGQNSNNINNKAKTPNKLAEIGNVEHKETDIAAKNARARAARSKFCLPLGGTLLAQTIIVITILAVVTWEFHVSTEQLTRTSIENQVHTMRIGLEKSIVSPLSEGEAAARAMVVTLQSEPSAYQVSLNVSLTEDFRSCQIAEGLIFSVQPIFIMAQVLEYQLPNGSTALATLLVLQDNGIVKTLQGQSYVATQYALSTIPFTKEAFGNQTMEPVALGVFEPDRSQGTIIGHNASGYSWTLFYWRSNLTDPSTALISYTLSYPINKVPAGVLGRNNWFGWISVNPINATRVLSDIIGTHDQLAALYDIKTAATPFLISSTIANFQSINPATSLPWAASASPYPTLNQWFGAIMSTCIYTGECDDVVTKIGKIFLGIGRMKLNREGLPGASNLEFVFILGSKEEAYFEDVHEMRITITWQICLAAGIIVLVAVFLITAFAIPILQMKKNFALAAVLRNDDVVPHGSAILELDWLLKSFELMNERLGAARAFLPAWMLLAASDGSSTDHEEVGDEEGEDDDDASQNEETTSEGELTVEGSQESPQASMMAASRSILTANKKSPSDAKKGKGSRVRMEAMMGSSGALTKGAQEATSGMATRRVAVLAIDIRNFISATSSTSRSGSSSIIHLSGPTTIVGATTALLDLISGAVNGERGVIDSFHGDHFIISFNANRVTGAPGRKAVQCALTVSELLRAKIPKYARVAMGAAVSQASVGVLGNTTQKRFSVVGSCYGKAIALASASKRLEKEADFFLTLAQKETLAIAQKQAYRRAANAQVNNKDQQLPNHKGFVLPSVVTEMSINPGGNNYELPPVSLQTPRDHRCSTDSPKPQPAH